MKVNISNAYDPLAAGIVAYPMNLKLTGQTQGNNEQLDTILACNQYNALLNTLTENNVKTYFIDITPTPSEVYTRDLGFLINNTFFISNMTAEERKPETDSLLNFAKKNRLNIHKMNNNIEGGDVLLHNDKVLIGVGDRTKKEAVDELRQYMIDHKWKHQIDEVYFDVSKIHLDCAFNIIDQDTCLITGSVFNNQDVEQYFKKVIKITDEESEHLGVNIVNLGNGKILSSNKKLCDKLKGEGFKPIFIDFSEVVKAKGSLGCSLLPLERKGAN